jgi:RHH-type proline utilization regulon transcriptional repressor/proline dehydrogenase/delta 1-pyrroline-5-carboxylate dehydrogenase
LPPELAAQIELRQSGDFTGLAGVLHAGPDDPILRWQLAAVAGALLPLNRVSSAAEPYPLFRMLSERVVSINTTAAGGNTTLMTLGI